MKIKIRFATVLRLTFYVLASLILMPLSPALAGTVDAGLSTVSTDKTSLKADGIENAQVSIRVRNTLLLGEPDVQVQLRSSRGELDEITPAGPTPTNSIGRATFSVRSLKNGTASFTATLNGQELGKSVTIVFGNGLSFPLKAGDLIKIPDDSDASTQPDTAVYYYASNGKRYVFSNEKVYFSWYQDFSNIKVLPIDQMSLIPIGGNVTYRPGSKLVKFQTDTKTYLPAKGGVLRWVQSEAAARGLFGSDWNKKIDDINEAFYVNYSFGQPIANALDASLIILQNSAHTINMNLGFGNP